MKLYDDVASTLEKISFNILCGSLLVEARAAREAFQRDIGFNILCGSLLVEAGTLVDVYCRDSGFQYPLRIVIG